MPHTTLLHVLNLPVFQVVICCPLEQNPCNLEADNSDGQSRVDQPPTVFCLSHKSHGAIRKPVIAFLPRLTRFLSCPLHGVEFAR